MKLFQTIKKAGNFLLDLLFPKECLGCKKEGEWFCEKCLKEIPLNQEIYCPVCQKKLNHNTVCFECQKKTSLDGFFSASTYENNLLKKAVKTLKYHYVTELSQALSHLLIKYLKNLNPEITKPILKTGPLIIPIPLHKKRLRERGFNQSELLGQGIATAFGFKYQARILERKIYTAPQAELSRKERLNNIKDCFKLKENFKLKGQTVILIDDVFTTGATMQETAKVLKKAGAKKVWGLTVAHG